MCLGVKILILVMLIPVGFLIIAELYKDFKKVFKIEKLEECISDKKFNKEKEINNKFNKEKEINNKYNVMDSKIFMKLYEKSIFNKIKKFNKKVYLTFSFLNENNSCQYIEYSYIVDGFKEFGGKFKRWDLDKLLYINSLTDINPKIIIDYINNDIKDTYFNKDLYFGLFDLLNIKNKQGLKKLKENIKYINEILKKGKEIDEIRDKILNNRNNLDLKKLFLKQGNNQDLKDNKLKKSEGDGKIGGKEDLKIYIK